MLSISVGARFAFTAAAIMLAALSVLPSTVWASASFGPDAEPDYAKIDNWVTAEMAQAPIPGLSLAIVKGQDIVHVAAFGTADDQGTAVTPDTPFVINSISKTFTALAIRQLVNVGKVDTRAPVQKYLPWFTPGGPEASSLITIQNLLDHTSGFSTVQGDEPYLHDPQSTLEELVRKASSVKPANPVGTRAYSNLNYLVLGVVIQQVSGQEYDTYIRQNVFAPLEMQHSYNDNATAEQNGLATGHRLLFGFPFAYKVAPSPGMHAAGYQISSAADMANYLVAYLNGGRYRGTSVLVPAGSSVSPPDQELHDIYWNPLGGTISATEWSGQSGGSVNYNSDLLVAPAQRMGVIVLTNSRTDILAPGVPADFIGLNVLRMMLGLEPPIPSDGGFHMGWVVIDTILLLLAAFAVAQVMGLPRWGVSAYQGPRQPAVRTWLPIAADFVLAGLLLVGVPYLLSTPWEIAFVGVPDVAYTVFGVGTILAAVGFIKVGIGIWGWVARQRRVAVPAHA